MAEGRAKNRTVTKMQDPEQLYAAILNLRRDFLFEDLSRPLKLNLNVETKKGPERKTKRETNHDNGDDNDFETQLTRAISSPRKAAQLQSVPPSSPSVFDRLILSGHATNSKLEEQRRQIEEERLKRSTPKINKASSSPYVAAAPPPSSRPSSTPQQSRGQNESPNNPRNPNAFASRLSAAVVNNKAKNPPPSAWKQYETTEGKLYYYNTETKETTWRAPLAFIPRSSSSSSSKHI